MGRPTTVTAPPPLTIGSAACRCSSSLSSCLTRRSILSSTDALGARVFVLLEADQGRAAEHLSGPVTVRRPARR